MSSSSSLGMAASKSYVIIAIDFGTTFSGVAWILSEDLKKVTPITRWPSAMNGAINVTQQPKVPTKLRYKLGRPISESKWGWNLDEDDTDREVTMEWFKLFLNYEGLSDEIKNSPRVKRCQRKLESIYGSGNAVNGAFQVTHDYISFLWPAAIKAMVDSTGGGYFRNLPVKIVITTPAIWSPQACDRTREAVKRAIREYKSSPFGAILALDLVPEPEAAARACLTMSTTNHRQPGHHFIIADCGGGTVDVISYTVTRLDPLELQECVEGTGDLCGAIFMDDEFEEFMTGHVAWEDVDSYSRQEIMNQYWELGIKRNFLPDPERRQEWHVAVGTNRFRFSDDQVMPLFQSACSRAVLLIHNQILKVRHKTGCLPKAVYLVGGMGRSEYLAYHLKGLCGQQIEVLHSNGDDPWSAVCRGAAIGIATKMNIGRISRCNYGFSYNGYFNPKIHTEDEKIWDNVTERLRAPKMDWIVKRGTLVRHLQPITTECTEMFRYPDDISGGIFRLPIWVSASENASEKKDQHVCELCVIDCYLPIASSTASTSTYRSAAQVLDQSLDREAILRFFYSLPKVTNRKREIYRQLDIDIVMSPRGQDLFFDVRFEGKSLKTEYRWTAGRDRGAQGVPLDLEPVQLR